MNGVCTQPDLVPTGTDLTALAEDVAVDGIVAHDERAASVARGALEAGLNPVLARIVLDLMAPPVARERALGRLAAEAARARISGV